ncbi:retrotransposon protein, putative, ty1-copia subclass [Tanacetum coccineum]
MILCPTTKKEVGTMKKESPCFILAELQKKRKRQVALPSSFRIFREARKLKQGALYLYVGNGVRAQVEAIGSFDLVLPNNLVICLDNCHYAPSITRGVVLVHRLVENGFVQCFTDFEFLVSINNVFYFNVIPSNSIYEIDMLDLVPNVNSIYNVSTKRAKHNLDSTYLWNCRLAHISKKRIERLQQEGILKSTDDESFDQCVSCLSGKMTRKSFPHRLKRATDLLGIIHTDVCSPLRHVSRQVLATSLHSQMIIVVMVMFIFLNINMRSLKRSKCLKMKLKINSGRPLRQYDHMRYDSAQAFQYVPIRRLTKTHMNVVGNVPICLIKETFIVKKISGRAVDLKEIQEEKEDTKPSEILSHIPQEVEGFEPPQEESDSDSFVDPNHPRKVCKLQISIYGLKQASRSWNKRFDEEIKGLDLDLREAAFILGIKIYRDRSKRLIGLSQNAYMDTILKRYKMDNSKRSHIPMQERLNLNKSQGAQTPKEVNRMKNVPYASAVGSIMYVVRCTRPDVAFAQNMTSRF